MTTSSDLGKALAALRRREPFTCEICGKKSEGPVRKSQPARTCSPACRQKLWRAQQKAPS